MSMKNSNDTIWDRTSDLPICSTAPQTLCYRGPQLVIIHNWNVIKLWGCNISLTVPWRYSLVLVKCVMWRTFHLEVSMVMLQSLTLTYAPMTCRALPKCDILFNFDNITYTWSWRLCGITPALHIIGIAAITVRVSCKKTNTTVSLPSCDANW